MSALQPCFTLSGSNAEPSIRFMVLAWFCDDVHCVDTVERSLHLMRALRKCPDGTDK